MNTFLFSLRRPTWVPSCVAAGLLVLAAGATAHAQAQENLPKTADIAFDVAADGSVNMAFQMTFDAAPWRSWKAMVGDEPARLRAMMRHQFAAMTLENFKLERDDMNRVAKMSMHSPAGPELREDGSYQIPVDGYFRPVSHAGREWYFSGNNPNAGYTLNNVKVTLPPNAVNAYVANPENPDQAVVFALVAPASPARWFYLGGSVVSLLGLALLMTGAFWRRRGVLRLPAVPSTLPAAGPMGSVHPLEASRPPLPVVPPAFNPGSIPPPLPPDHPRATPPTFNRPYVSGEPD